MQLSRWPMWRPLVTSRSGHLFDTQRTAKTNLLCDASCPVSFIPNAHTHISQHQNLTSLARYFFIIWRCVKLGQFPFKLAVPVRLEGAPVVYAGGLRDDCTGHHSFTFMCRKGSLYRLVFRNFPSDCCYHLRLPGYRSKMLLTFGSFLI